VLHWIQENQPLINFGLLVGAIVYTIITGLILRTSTRQVRTMVQPALTLNGPYADNRQPALNLGSLRFRNTGTGSALNVVIEVAVHQGSALNRLPTFDREITRVPSAVPPGAEYVLGSLHTAVESGRGPSGNLWYKLLHEYEVFFSYSSIAGANISPTFQSEWRGALTPPTSAKAPYFDVPASGFAFLGATNGSEGP
jgi:hypothetical protein